MTDDNDLSKKSRAELLELCKAQGLKASGWKKEKMLEALGGAVAAVAGVGAELSSERVQELTDAPVDLDDDNQATWDEAVVEQAERKKHDAALQGPSGTRSGWCMVHWPLWTIHHTRCRAREQYGSLISCICECHVEGWVQPPIPEGASLSKFETPESRAAALSGAEVTEARAAKVAAAEKLAASVAEPTSVAGEVAAAIGEALEQGSGYQEAVESAAASVVWENVTDEQFAEADQQSMVTGQAVEDLLAAPVAPAFELAPLDPALVPWLAWAQSVPDQGSRLAQYQSSGLTPDQTAAVEQHLAVAGETDCE